MATNYPDSTDQRDIMPAIYLWDPRHAPYTESSSLPGNMLYLNYSSSNVYSDTLPGSSQSQHNSAELPVHTTMLSQESSMGGYDLGAPHIGDSYFDAWRDGRNCMAHTVSRHQTTADAVVLSHVTNDPQMDLRTQLGILGRQKLLQQPSGISGMQGQGLSLSLSTQMSVPSLRCQPTNSDTSFVCSHQSAMENSLCARDREIHVETSPNGFTKLAFPITNSKYLKAAQQLLDDFVNVQKALKQRTDKSHTSYGATKVSDRELEDDEVQENPQESSANSAPDLSPTERQCLQNRMTKLLAMSDEVDRRYKQYYHQIHTVVSSFDVVAGRGAAKPYTALALQAISRHFRCLRDAIDSQIRATSKSLGEQELSPSSGKGPGIFRLRYIDQEIRQQRAFQRSAGMVQHHAWRPQRGLPETSVSILRAWLFEHFLHPYPKDSDKLMLARQTGLTRNQVSNWFINARVRLWKPMIDDMYKDEFGDTQLDSNLENTPKGKENSSSKDGSDSPNLESATCHLDGHGDPSTTSVLIHDVQMDVAVTGFQRDVNTGETGHMGLRLGEHKPSMEDGNLLHDVLVRHDEDSRYMAYQMAELGKYGNGGVSLTLGLQHCHGGLPVSEGHQSFVAVTGDGIYNSASLGVDMADYDYLSVADRQHKFGSSQLLHDFVA